MSKGNRILKVRIPAELLKEIELQIAQRNLVTLNEPWSVSDFLRAAVVEKLKHMERSRRPKKR